MSLTQGLAFAVAMLVFSATPGPGILTVVSKGLGAGFGVAMTTALGVICGDVCFLLFALFGLSALADTLQSVLWAVQYLGAAYLIYLGVTLFFAHEMTFARSSSTQKGRGSPFFNGFITGYVITLGNPKAILFYLALLPTFFDLALLNTQEMLVIAAMVVFILGLTLIVYAYLSTQAQYLLQSKRTQRMTHRISGSLMLGVGVFMALRD